MRVEPQKLALCHSCLTGEHRLGEAEDDAFQRPAQTLCPLPNRDGFHVQWNITIPYHSNERPCFKSSSSDTRHCSPCPRTQIFSRGSQDEKQRLWISHTWDLEQKWFQMSSSEGKASVLKPSFASNGKVSYIYLLMIMEKLHPSQAAREQQPCFLESKTSVSGPQISLS